MATVKQQLYNLCYMHLEEGIAEAMQSTENARDAARNETKSSAGDKYETSREMMQQDIDMNKLRIAALQQQMATLLLIDPNKITPVIQNGSIVRTSQGNYYVGVSIGKLLVENMPYYTLTAAAPLGARLAGKKKGDKFTFNGREFIIMEVE